VSSSSFSPTFHSDFSSSRLGKGTNVKLKLGPVTVLVLIMALVAGMGVLSLTQLNSMSTQGYLIKELEDKNKGLVEDSEINSMLILQARSLESIAKSDIVLSMQEPSNVYYLGNLTGLASADGS